MVQVRYEHLRFLSVYINTKTQAEERKLLFGGKIPADCLADIDLKRFKKDVLQILEAITKFKAFVLLTSNQ